MSRFGLDLLGRENPPPGYYSASEYWRIQGVGDQPVNLTVQMVDCHTSYKLFSPKDASKPQGAWNMIKSKQPFLISFPAVSTSLDQFRDIVAKECEKQFEGTEAAIQNAIRFGSPHIDWKISMKLPAADEFLKPAKYTVNDENSYSHWIATIVDNGKDHTDVVLEVAMVNPTSLKKDEKVAIELKKHNLKQAAAQQASSSNPSVKASEFDPINILANKIYATHPPNVKYQPKLPVFIHPTDRNQYIPLTAGNVQKWATALVKPDDGVSLHSPPADMKFETLSSAKKRKLNEGSSHQTKSPEPDSESDSVIDLGVNLLNEYLEFVKIPPGDRDGILHILTENKATNPQLFRSKNITREVMKEWGLHDVFIAQLQDNVLKFEKHMSSQ
ncbi:uncharacterized protein PGTG_19417 [Puccinia graminis f. sp. tritici CRL 75-36-700-3]|uniref:Uncharacterized protein n=1 Tax=Puccinia graminis f. sp. tritici (strain CRL 75-36-700-3 / race SCCL) TaxID=418459 RepID=E3LA24_PUCGT|nr:uncharacterized protein PGTG_19417 [Puccinia graminis f. sp. tritici CRL 75-36-700-3]EFP93399.1 hypothetical protein PGTG_19417 [Puccinia graminis f. sp. tritici CRL 75-36-700-3]